MNFTPTHRNYTVKTVPVLPAIKYRVQICCSLFLPHTYNYSYNVEIKGNFKYDVKKIFAV